MLCFGTSGLFVLLSVLYFLEKHCSGMYPEERDQDGEGCINPDINWEFFNLERRELRAHRKVVLKYLEVVL